MIVYVSRDYWVRYALDTLRWECNLQGIVYLEDQANRWIARGYDIVDLTVVRVWPYDWNLIPRHYVDDVRSYVAYV